MKNKRGELTSGQIISIIIAIAGFVVLLIFLGVFLDDGFKSEEEICRLSVLTRATSPDALQNRIPLSCTTGKICIRDGGECEQFAGESGVRYVNVDSENIVESAREIERVTANAMFDCWNIMGEGKVDLFHNAPEQFLGSSGDATCVVCSRVAIAESVLESDSWGAISVAIDVDEYMRTNNIPGQSVTYLQAFHKDSGVNTYASVDGGADFAEAEDIDEIRSLSDGQSAVVFSQVKTEKVGNVLRNAGAFALGATFVIPYKAKIAKALFLTPTGLVTVGIAAVGGGIVGAGIAAYALQGQRAAAGYCGEFTTAASGDSDNLRQGCSLVQVVDYSVQGVNTLCGNSIQGSP